MRLLWSSHPDNKSQRYYETDAEGKPRRGEMIEEIMPWDIVSRFNQYQQDVFVPIKIKTAKEREL